MNSAKAEPPPLETSPKTSCPNPTFGGKAPDGARHISFAAALTKGMSKTYGHWVKQSFPPLSFSESPVPATHSADDDGHHVHFTPEEEWRLAQPLKWVVRGLFRGRRKGIAKVDEAILSTVNPRGPFHVSAAATDEVFIRFELADDAIRLLARNFLRIEGIPLRLIRWSPLPKNADLFYSWSSLRGLPPHLTSTPAIQAQLKPWATVLAVDRDVRHLTRPEVTRVFLEVDAKSPPPPFFFLHGLGGTIKISMELQQVLRKCSYCQKLGHEVSLCRVRLRRDARSKKRRAGKQPTDHSTGNHQTPDQMGESTIAAPEEPELMFDAAGSFSPTASEVHDGGFSASPKGSKTPPSPENLENQPNCKRSSTERPTSPRQDSNNPSPRYKTRGPWQWTSQAGDTHVSTLYYPVPTVQDDWDTLPPERWSNVDVKSFNQPLQNRQPRCRDPKFKCGQCKFALVHARRTPCRICAFQDNKKKRSSRSSPPKYSSLSDLSFDISAKLPGWEAAKKAELVNIANKTLKPLMVAAGKKKQIGPSSPAKTSHKWGDITSEDEDFLAPGNKLCGKGIKIKSRLEGNVSSDSNPSSLGRGPSVKDDGLHEVWLDGIRMVKVRRHNHRCNTSWLQWKVAPEVNLSRGQRNKLEEKANRGFE